MPLSAANRPVITPAMVLSALRRIALPRAETIAQPHRRTLVNLETIFHTGVGPLQRTVTLLGQHVHLSIRPSTFRWRYGDGSSATTHTAGAAYPKKTIVHRYQHAHVTVHPSVRVTWSATYSVNGGPTHTVPGTVTTTGPATTLRIEEADPALSGFGH
ncbi:MAG TPA: hypothetical protein VF426_07065 [Marmoricola sp.]